MRDGRLVGAGCLVPDRSPPVELGDDLGLTPLQLGSQELSKLVVEPIPPAPPVERHEKQVRPRDRLQLARRPTGFEHCVAQRPAHPIEDRCSRQEVDVLRPQSGEVLEVEVVGHEPVLTPHSGTVVTRASVLERQRGEIGTDRPAFRSTGQLGDVLRVVVDVDCAQEQFDFAPTQCQLCDTYLEQATGRPHTCNRQPRQDTTREHERRAVWNVLRECGDCAGALSRPKLVDVVEHEHERLVGGEQGRGESPDGGRGGRPGGAAQPGRGCIAQPSPGKCLGDRAREGDRIVVLLVDRDPDEQPAVTGGPLCERRRLPVTGGGEHGHERTGGGRSQAVEQRHSGHAPCRDGRNPHLHLQNVEGLNGLDVDELRVRASHATSGVSRRRGRLRRRVAHIRRSTQSQQPLSRNDAHTGLAGVRACNVRRVRSGPATGFRRRLRAPRRGRRARP